MGFVWRTLINAVAIAVAAYLLQPRIAYGMNHLYGYGNADPWISLLLTAFVLGIVNAFVRPIVELISLPISCVTLGLFHFVVGGLMLLLVSAIPFLDFKVDGILTAIVGAVVIGVVGFLVARVIPH